MDDNAKVKSALSNALIQIDQGLNALRNPQNARSGLEETPALGTMRKDFISVISLVHTHATRLWIALGKLPSTPSAACATLDIISGHTSTLYGCALALKDISAPIFFTEARTSAIEILLALQYLLQGYASGADGNDTMKRTASLHEICDISRNISLDEREAALKRWKQDTEAFKDAIKELRELVDPTDASEETRVEDGWDELIDDEGSDVGLSDEERTTAKKVLMVFEKISALRKQVQKSRLSRQFQAQETPHSYEEIVKASNAMIGIIDNLVAALMPPLELEATRGLLVSLYKMASLDIDGGESETVLASTPSSLTSRLNDIMRAIQGI